jgi:hypothetical protein
MTEASLNPEGRQETLLTEPVTKPDGRYGGLLKLFTFTGCDSVEVYVDGIRTGYSHDETMALGEGDFHKGVMAIGQAYYGVSNERLVMGGNRLSLEEIIER